MRIELRPLPSLQIAASRTAQWCGDDRPCDGGTFWDMLTGNDNDQDLSEQPGNQLAGFDVRWTWPAEKSAGTVRQGIGEDEAGFLPSKYMGCSASKPGRGRRRQLARARRVRGHGL